MLTMVFVADESPANAWLIREVERHHVIRCIIRPDWTVRLPAARSTSRSAANAGAGGGAMPPSAHPSASRPALTRLLRRLRSLYFTRRDAAYGQRLTRALFDGVSPAAPAAMVWTVPAWEINAHTVTERLRALNPDLIVVSGAPMLRPNIYTLPRGGTVNVHCGISPNYRGMHTVITPLQRGDYAHVGSTVHYVDDGVDSGPVLFRVYPDMTPSDSPESIEAQIVRRSASALCEFLSWLAAMPPGTIASGRRFTERGELVRFHDRRIRDDLLFRLQRGMGATRPTLPARTERFYTS